MLELEKALISAALEKEAHKKKGVLVSA